MILPRFPQTLFRLRQVLFGGRIVSNEFMSAVERGAKLPYLPVLERIANALMIEIKDLFNFDRTNYHRLKPIPKKVIDLAFERANDIGVFTKQGFLLVF